MNLDEEFEWPVIYPDDDKWAVIQKKGKISTIRITDWPKYEWDDFKTIKKDVDILLFDKEKEAVDFILEHFDKSQIDPVILADNDLPEGYRW